MESLSLESFEDTSCWIMVLGAEQRSGRVPRVWPSPTSSPVTGQSSQASKPVWQMEPPECGLLIEPWQWGKVSWGASMALAVLSFYNPGRWQRATSPCPSAASLLSHSPAGSTRPSRTAQAGWLCPLAQRRSKETLAATQTLSPTQYPCLWSNPTQWSGPAEGSPDCPA